MALVQSELQKCYIGTGNTPRLPSAYQEVEYIESSGTQYINTGLKISDGYRFVSKLLVTTAGTGTGSFITGGYLGYSGGIYYRLYFGGIGGSQGNGWTYGYLSQYANGGLSTASLNTIYDIEFSWISGNAYINVDNTSLFYSSNTYSYTSNYECPLFAINENGPISPSKGLRVYSAKYYDINDDLVRNFVPCYRISDNVIGMYDLVNDVFYTNSGSGTFTKGADVDVPYTEIKKIMKGATQIRPSGWTPGANTLVYYNINDNDTNSTIYDLTNNHVDQTWHGTPGYATDATYGRVATFDGSSYTQAGSIVNFGSECTFIALYKKNTANANMAVVTECATSSEYAIGIANEFDNNKSQVRFQGSGGGWQVQSSTLATTNWVMVAGTIDSNFTTRIYINGELDNTSTDGTSAPGYSGGENLQIGRWRSGAPRYLNGQFKLFIGENRCWTDAEIAALAQEFGFAS